MGGYTLNRTTSHRNAMRRNMAVSLLTHEQITTTIPKAKSLKPFVEKLISLGKRGDLAARRQVIQAIGDPVEVKSEDDPRLKRNRYGELVRGPRLVKKLFEEIAPRYQDRPGGYTRIVRLAKHRIGDGADLCVLQLVSEDESGPQVRGQHSRRREKAYRRMEFAAKARRSRAEAAVGGGAAAEGPGEAESATATATEEPPAESEQAGAEGESTGEGGEPGGDRA
jgi:large subunit ribosomal protein L17